MSAEPAFDIEYASIQRIFNARDERIAAENARIAAEARHSAQNGGKRVASSRSVSGTRAAQNGGRRLEQPRRTSLEYIPERDEFGSSGRTADVGVPQRRTATTQRSKSGTDLKTAERKTRSGAHSKAKGNIDAKKAGGIGAAVTGIGGALLLFLNVIFPSAPADAPSSRVTQGCGPELKPIHYQMPRTEGDHGAIKLSDNEYYIETGNDISAEPVDVIEEVEETPVYVPIEHVSDNLISAMKEFEGIELTAYKCAGNVWTIGYGHTADVYEGQTITLDEAKELLRQDLDSRERVVREYAASQNVQLTQGQFDALVDFTYNLGVGNFENSGLVEMIGEGDIDGAAAHIQEYVYARNEAGEKVKLGGLVARRAVEAEWLYA